jgi:4-alpha-glucanotransferase
MTNPPTPDLAELATRHGVATEFWDWRGNHVEISADSLIAVLGALGVDASTSEAVDAALAADRTSRYRRMLPPTIVAIAGEPARFSVAVPEGAPVTTWVELESGGDPRGTTWVAAERDAVIIDGVPMIESTYDLPADLPEGYHQVHARAGRDEAVATLIVTPRSVPWPESLHGQRAWGYLAQLYSVRSSRSWGVGDLGDLAELAQWAGRDQGAEYVLVNPLHAAEPVPPMTASPYLPTTRRFPNPLYLRVEDVPEYAGLDDVARARSDELAAPLRAVSRTPDPIDRDSSWAAKREVLRLVYDVPRSAERQASFDSYVTQEGRGLRDFAIWCALAITYGSEEWPEPLRRREPAALAEAERVHADEIAFQCWLQWALDDQLRNAQATAREAGMALGVLHDLAVGVHPAGATAWSLADVLATGVTVGAPPDEFNQLGQDWSQPPWNPRMLAETGYAVWRDLLRTMLRHAGGLRIDHVPGLFRLWLVPAGRSAAEGTYLRYDHEALVGILALEASRAGAVVVGEDLGTVEPWVRSYLAERGVLGTSLLWFERDEHGRPKRPEQWRELALATVGTHDLPPTAGYLEGVHVDLRGELGVLTRSLEEERAADAAGRADWLALLHELSLLRPGAAVEEIIDALHRFLELTPSRLVGVQLVDVVGDKTVQNQPGTDAEYPNWRQPLRDGTGTPVLLDDLPSRVRPPFESSRLRSVS